MDEQRRAAERAAASGDDEARAQDLLQRVRLGQLDEDRLRFAARLGHRPAALVLESHAPPIDAALAGRYSRPLLRAAERALINLDGPWGDDAVALLGAFAANEGDLRLARRLLALDGPLACPRCGETARVGAARPVHPCSRAMDGAPLPLESPRWTELRLGRWDIPGRVIRRLGDDPGGDVWDDLWGVVHHQGDVLDVTFAVVPHIVQLAERLEVRRRWQHLRFVASVYAHASTTPPDDLVSAFEVAIVRARRLALGYSLGPDGGDSGMEALAALCAGIDDACWIERIRDDGEEVDLVSTDGHDVAVDVRGDEPVVRSAQDQ